MNDDAKDKPWIASPSTLSQQEWAYCRIHHFPYCADIYRVSYVQIRPGDDGRVITHQHSSELVCVLSGEVLVQAGELRQRAKTHDVVFLPKNTPHAFVALSGEATLLVVHTPAVPPNQDHASTGETLAAELKLASE